MTPLETAIGKVHASGKTGVPFAAFTQEEQAYLTGGLVPQPGQPFSPAVRALLDGYRLVVSSAALQAINAHTANLPHKVAPQTLTDGSQVIGADVLTWCADSDPFGPLRPLFHSLPIRHITDADFPPAISLF
jgi:hypothetical protein